MDRIKVNIWKKISGILIVVACGSISGISFSQAGGTADPPPQGDGTVFPPILIENDVVLTSSCKYNHKSFAKDLCAVCVGDIVPNTECPKTLKRNFGGKVIVLRRASKSGDCEACTGVKI